MLSPAPSSSMARSGITLLEVLMAMFVLAVGILSIFGLFTAGRELEARAAIKSEAIAYAGTLSNTISNEWVTAWPDWLYVDQSGGFARVGAMGSGTCISLPVLIDPCGLSNDTAPGDRGTFLQNAVSETRRPDWKWSQMTPLASGTVRYQPFARVTLPVTTGGLLPPTREGAVASVSDQDSIEYEISANATDPPRNAFELGRRKRGSELVPALFVAATGNSLSQTAIVAGAPIRRTLLIFHKPPVDMEANTWPAGYLEFAIQAPQEGLVEASLTRIPQDMAVVRRSLRPGNWLMIAERMASGGPQPYRYEIRWVKIKSATANNPSQTSWLFVIDQDYSTTNEAWCYAFERLVHAVQLDPATLP